ncbi:MAG: hypothetical protein IK106_03295 [Clostridiales bacterium]|nr:hypothetical protein [Clostridiales bacterium]
MQLKSLNCKNCGNPLREENGRLHCSVCGSSFDMDVSVESQKMEHIQKSLEEAEASIESDKKALEQFMRVKEAAEIEEERKRKQRMEEQMREIRKRASRRAIRQLLITLIISFAVVVLLIFLAVKYGGENKKKKSQNAAPPTYVEKNYRITPSELKNCSAFLEEVSKKAIEGVKKDHDGSVFDSQDDGLYIWNRTGEPYVSEYYLVTRDDGNYLYMLIVLPMHGVNNAPQSDAELDRDVYIMAYVEDVYIGEDGKVNYYEDKIRFDGSSKYNFMWHADFNKDILVEELVAAKETDQKKPYIVHQFEV